MNAKRLVLTAVLNFHCKRVVFSFFVSAFHLFSRASENKRKTAPFMNDVRSCKYGPQAYTVSSYFSPFIFHLLSPFILHCFDVLHKRTMG